MAITRTVITQSANKNSAVSLWTVSTPVSIASGSTILVALGTGQLESTATVKYNNIEMLKLASNSIDSLQTNSIEQSIWVLFSTAQNSGNITVSWSTNVEEKALIAILVSEINTFRSAVISQGSGSVTTLGSTGATINKNTFIWSIAVIGGGDSDASGVWSSSYQASNQGVRVGTNGGSALSNVTINEGYATTSVNIGGATGNLSGFSDRPWVALTATFYYVSELDAYFVSNLNNMPIAQINATDATSIIRNH